MLSIHERQKIIKHLRFAVSIAAIATAIIFASTTAIADTFAQEAFLNEPWAEVMLIGTHHYNDPDAGRLAGVVRVSSRVSFEQACSD